MYTKLFLTSQHSQPRVKSEKEISSEIQAIIRQICASVTFLPLLEAQCTFDILLYTDSDLTVPLAWEETDPQYIKNAESVRLRSFDTKVCFLHFVPWASCCKTHTGHYSFCRYTKLTAWWPTQGRAVNNSCHVLCFHFFVKIKTLQE